MVFRRADDGALLTVRAPNDNGDITEQAALAACDAARIDPIAFAVHWCD